MDKAWQSLNTLIMNFGVYWLFVLMAWTSSFSCWAYTNFIGYGYKNCTTCHYNAFGGGPLNDYGRALYATAIASKLFYPQASEEKVTQWSHFLGGLKIPKIGGSDGLGIYPSINIRHLKMQNGLGSESETERDIAMNNEVNVVLTYGERNMIYYSLSVSTYPEAESVSAVSRDEYISREHYLGLNLSQGSLGLRAQGGIFDTVYGLRIPDHIAYSKDLLGLDQSDQQLGVAGYLSWGIVEGGLHAFFGNPNEENAEVRQKGFSLMGEIDVAENSRLGASLLVSSSEFIEKMAYAIHGRIPFGKGSSLIAELGNVNVTPVQGGLDEESNLYAFTQGMVRLFRGFHFLTTFEFNSFSLDGSETTQYRFGPGLMWFPVQRLELRADLVNIREISNVTVPEDIWNLYINFHLSL